MEVLESMIVSFDTIEKLDAGRFFGTPESGWMLGPYLFPEGYEYKSPDQIKIGDRILIYRRIGFLRYELRWETVTRIVSGREKYVISFFYGPSQCFKVNDWSHVLVDNRKG